MTSMLPSTMKRFIFGAGMPAGPSAPGQRDAVMFFRQVLTGGAEQEDPFASPRQRTGLGGWLTSAQRHGLGCHIVSPKG
jgi:hypothetical protein